MSARQAIGQRIIAHTAHRGDPRSWLERIVDLDLGDMRGRSAIDFLGASIVNLNLGACGRRIIGSAMHGQPRLFRVPQRTPVHEIGQFIR